MKTTILEHIENPSLELVEKVKEFQNRKEQVLKELEKEMNDKGKLQNNFTTVEQSKRLLEIGLPADSTDCYLTRFGTDEDFEVKVLNNVKYSEIAISNQKYCLPCWSVGRLMEIIDMCSVKQDYIGKFEFEMNKSYIQNLIYLIIGMLHTKDLDFSKLEE